MLLIASERAADPIWRVSFPCACNAAMSSGGRQDAEIRLCTTVRALCNIAALVPKMRHRYVHSDMPNMLNVHVFLNTLHQRGTPGRRAPRKHCAAVALSRDRKSVV